MNLQHLVSRTIKEGTSFMSLLTSPLNYMSAVKIRSIQAIQPQTPPPSAPPVAARDLVTLTKNNFQKLFKPNRDISISIRVQPNPRQLHCPAKCPVSGKGGGRLPLEYICQGLYSNHALDKHVKSHLPVPCLRTLAKRKREVPERHCRAGWVKKGNGKA